MLQREEEEEKEKEEEKEEEEEEKEEAKAAVCRTRLSSFHYIYVINNTHANCWARRRAAACFTCQGTPPCRPSYFAARSCQAYRFSRSFASSSALGCGETSAA
jgi:hypothetical protein